MCMCGTINPKKPLSLTTMSTIYMIIIIPKQKKVRVATKIKKWQMAEGNNLVSTHNNSNDCNIKPEDINISKQKKLYSSIMIYEIMI